MRARSSGLVVAAFVGVLLAGCGATRSSSEAGEAFPQREVTLIVPFPAGSPSDATFRRLANGAEKHLGQTIVIVNRPGGNGTVGAAQVLAAEPDGYTIGMGATSTICIQPFVQDTAFEGPQDLQPIMGVVSVPFALFVGDDTGIRSVDGFVEEAKERPGSIRISPGQFNNVADINIRELADNADVELRRVPYDAPENVLAVVNGTIEAGATQLAPVLAQQRKGNVRVLGLFGDERPRGSDVPLLAEEGYEAGRAGVEFLFAPKGVPADRRRRLHDSFKRALEEPAFRSFADKQQLIVAYRDETELGRRLAEDARFYQSVVGGE